MTVELTAEEIVTKILSANEIIKKKNSTPYITTFANLSEYLKNLTPEEIKENDNILTTTTPSKEEDKECKYTFIKEGGWKF